ncbi:MAG: glycosyltransferase family 2 protein [Hyphomicrobium aestuarii]|nr:glycosyltransferase family 2 protein [Hyphomicrobium aestuarii]
MQHADTRAMHATSLTADRPRGHSTDGAMELPVDVTIIMPCLNEVLCLPHCIANANEALALMKARLGLDGEILIADNGSTDGSQALAASLGACVVAIPLRGYGAALAGGARAARGRFLVMGDADGSYDFRDAVAMVERLTQGAELCMGSRFKGEIKPGAMPWKNRYLGNPVLTGILNILFRSGISDAHCGLRAIRRDCFDRLGLTGHGMEFASEMVIKATLKNVRIAEVPATLSPDLRDRPPHLRPWRDGWRHLRYLFMLSPIWLFAVPAAILAAISIAILGYASFAALAGSSRTSPVGNYWVILAGAMLAVSHLAALLAASSHVYGVREGYRLRTGLSARLAGYVSLESMLVGGIVLMLAGFGILASVLAYWSATRFEPIFNVLPAILGTTLVVIGTQTAFGGFLLSIIAGNDANFLKPVSVAAAVDVTAPEAAIGGQLTAPHAS